MGTIKPFSSHTQYKQIIAQLECHSQQNKETNKRKETPRRIKKITTHGTKTTTTTL